jgi:hypothetical protein
MQIKKLLKIENIIEGRAIPCDMLDDSLNAHYSKSRGEEIKIIDMHLPHLVRAYSNLLEENKVDIQLYKEGWNAALESLKK